MGDDTFAVEAFELYKIFGRRSKEAVRKLKADVPRDRLGPGATAAVIDATFQVKPGEIFVVMGLSGSGKSTLIRMLNGLLEPTAGSVTVQGTRISGIAPSRLRTIRQKAVSMVFQHFALMPHRTVLENAAYGLEVQGVPRPRRTSKALEMIKTVGLDGWANSYPDELSGGMKQRVGLARALAAETDILLMDEAFSALDPLIRREMQVQLITLQQDLNKTIIFITHDLNEAMFLGDRIAVMRDGRIVQIGTPEEILTDPANDYVAQFVQDVDRARVLTASSAMEQPRSVVPLSAGPRGALRMMRDLQTSAAFVTGPGRRLLGYVTDRETIDLVRSSRTDLKAVLHTDFSSTPPGASLIDLVEPAVESALPIAVVEDDQLIGVVPRVTLLASLGSSTTAARSPQSPAAAEEERHLPAGAVDLALKEGAVDGHR